MLLAGHSKAQLGVSKHQRARLLSQAKFPLSSIQQSQGCARERTEERTVGRAASMRAGHYAESRWLDGHSLSPATWTYTSSPRPLNPPTAQSSVRPRESTSPQAGGLPRREASSASVQRGDSRVYDGHVMSAGKSKTSHTLCDGHSCSILNCIQSASLDKRADCTTALVLDVPTVQLDRPTPCCGVSDVLAALCLAQLGCPQSRFSQQQPPARPPLLSSCLALGMATDPVPWLGRRAKSQRLFLSAS